MTWSYETWHHDALIETHNASFDVWVRDQAGCRALLAAHGLRVEAEYAGYNGAAWRDDSSAARYVFEARIW